MRVVHIAVGVVLVAAVAYLRYRLTPPKDVVGTCLKDTPGRAAGLIRQSVNQQNAMGEYLVH